MGYKRLQAARTACGYVQNLTAARGFNLARKALQASSRLSLPLGTAIEQQLPRLLLRMPPLELKTDLADGLTTVKTPNTNLTQRTSGGINKVSHKVVYSTKKKEPDAARTGAQWAQLNGGAAQHRDKDRFHPASGPPPVH